MAKLTDNQLIVLSKAAARDDGVAVAPHGMGKAAAAKVGSSLVARKLMRESRSKPGMPVWREAEGKNISLVITRAGRDAIGVGDDAMPSDRSGLEATRASAAVKTQKASVAEQLETAFDRRSASRRIQTGAHCRHAVEGRGRDDRCADQGDRLAAAYNTSGSDGASQARFCSRTHPARAWSIALSDRELPLPGSGLI